MDEVKKKWNLEDEDDIIWGVDLLYKSEFSGARRIIGIFRSRHSQYMKPGLFRINSLEKSTILYLK